MKTKRLFMVMLMFLSVFTLFACGGINVSITGNGTVEEGKTIVLQASASKSGATFVWASDNEAVATVSDGTVTGVSAGNANITVTATVGNKTASATKQVRVTADYTSDAHKPVISGATDKHIQKGATFIPLEGITASDPEDGDITNKIVYQGNVNPRAVGEYTATYTVKDSHNNETSVTIKVYVEFSDLEKPFLTGVADKSIMIGEAFDVKTGVFAEDTTDGDLTDAIQIVGSVDIWTAGEYTVQYSVRDAAGNESTATRKITVGLGVFTFGEGEDKTFAAEGQVNSMNISGGASDSLLADYVLGKLTFTANAEAACKATVALAGALCKGEIDLEAGEHQYSIYFRIDEELTDALLQITLPSGASATLSAAKFAFGEAKDNEPPVITVGEGEVVLPGTVADAAALKAFVLNGVSATDNIDQIITSRLDVDFSGIELGNCFEEKEVTIFVEDSSGNRAEVKRTVKFVNVYDTKLISDPTFTNPDIPMSVDAGANIYWGLNGGSGDPSLNVIDGVLVHKLNAAGVNAGWDSASSPFIRTTTDFLSAGNWYLLKFDVKAEVARKMTMRIGIETTEALSWIENFSGGNNEPVNITTEWQTVYFMFYVHANQSQGGMKTVKFEFKVGTFTWGGEEQGNTVYFDNMSISLCTNDNSAPSFTLNEDLPTTFGKGAEKPDLTQYVTAYDREDADYIAITAANITESINMNAAGEYVVKYKVADSEGSEAEYSLTIKVLETADTVAPVISEAPGIVKSYDQFGTAPDLTALVVVNDAVDGVIIVKARHIDTDFNINVAGSYTVDYAVKDSSGNEATFQLTLVVNDKEAPVITGKGIISTDQGKALTKDAIMDQYAATDNVDESVVISDVDGFDDIDFATPGEYEVKIIAVDAAGNRGELAVTIKVKAKGATVTVLDEKLQDLLENEPAGEGCTVTYGDEEATINVPNVGGWASVAKLKLPMADLVEGKTYALKFVAKADQERQVKMNIGIALWAEPWCDYFTLIDATSEQVIGTEYAEYIFMFTYDKENREGGPTLEFCVGNTGHAGDINDNDIYVKELAVYSTKEVSLAVETVIKDFMTLEFVGENASATLNDGVYEINPTDVGGWASAAKVKITDFGNMEVGKTYTLRLEVKADQARYIEIHFGDQLSEDPWINPYTLDVDKCFAIGTEYQVIDLVYTIDKSGVGGPVMEFCVGQTWHDGDVNGNCVYLKQFKLIEITEGGEAEKANVNLFPDWVAQSDYQHANWLVERYETDAWVPLTSSVQMRCRTSPSGVPVVNFANGYNYAMRFTYSDGPSLGLAKQLKFKVGNYWSNAEAMDVKIILVDTDGEQHYLLGSADSWYSFPVTTDVVDQLLTFEEMEVEKVVFVTRSAVQGYTYIYVGDCYLQYEDAAPEPLPYVPLTDCVVDLLASETAGTGCNVSYDVNGALVEISNPGAYASAATIKMPITGIESGKSYKLSLIAKADAARGLKLNIGIGLWAEPWYDLFTISEGSATPILGTEYATYDIYFTYDKENREGGPYIEFCCGSTGHEGDIAGNNVYIKQLAIYAVEEEPVEPVEPTKANIDLFADWASGADYQSANWKVEQYGTEWTELTNVQMRCREKDGVHVVNMANGYSMARKYTYSTGSSLGLANKIAFKVGNYYDGAQPMDVKLIIVDKDGVQHYLLGDASTFFSMPVTEGLIDQEFEFDDIEVTAVVFCTKSAINGSAFLYVGECYLTYEEEEVIEPVDDGKADLTLFSDWKEQSDYVNANWSVQRYEQGEFKPVSGCQMRCRTSPNGTHVVNFANGAGYVYQYTYSTGESLGLANQFSFKLGNYFSGAQDIALGIGVIDTDGNQHLLLGESLLSPYVLEPTQDLESFSFDFDEIEVQAIVVVSQSALQGNAYLYMGDAHLGYVEAE